MPIYLVLYKNTKSISRGHSCPLRKLFLLSYLVKINVYNGTKLSIYFATCNVLYLSGQLNSLVSYKICLDRYCHIRSSLRCRDCIWPLVGHPEPEKKILLAFLSTFWHPCSKCSLMCFKKDRSGCQVWKCPKVPELGQRSTECKFLYIRLILAFLSISYPKL